MIPRRFIESKGNQTTVNQNKIPGVIKVKINLKNQIKEEENNEK